LAQRRQNGELTEKVKYLEEKLGTQRQEIEGIQQKFQRDFEAVANKLLLESSNRFGVQSAESLDKLLGPLRENLKDFKVKLDTVQQETATHSALLKDQISRIGAEAANLSKALKGDVKVLGNWGENMLDQILERSGLQLGLHYRRQSGAKEETGEQRFLDVVIDLPDDRHLVIDFDIIGFSYYPLWHTAVSFASLPALITKMKTTYGKKVMILETGYPWATGGSDTYGNQFGSQTPLPDFPFTPDGQYRFMKSLTQAVITAGGTGIMYWEPAWISSQLTDPWGKGSSWENVTFYDF
jgi:hypothetical protein